MSIPSNEMKREIFRNELFKMKKGEYISEEDYVKTMKAYTKFCANIEIEAIQVPKKAETVEQRIIKKPEPLNKTAPTVKKVIKNKATLEQMRERNISWLLNLGVILLLIGGLYVATSNWEIMPNFMKTSSIAFISVLFYGMAFIAKKFLKIEKTAFAFIVLGSLFLPIFVLSIGWFELFGPYFSFYGEGRFILGVMGSLMLIPVYALFAKQLKSRLFVWFSYIALTAFVGFLLAALHLEQDGFYLGMMIYNALLIVSFHWLKTREKMKLFTKELVYFAQISLILSTLFMLVFFNSPILYSVNILLTAAVYLSMVYVTGRKEFHFVFSVMVVYGAYQLIEHSILDGFGPVFYALVGVGFLAVPRVLDREYHWGKIFRITSAAVSALAFIFISIEGILLKMNEPSFVLVLAYFIIAVQFTYLAHVMKNGLFVYLSPIFLATTLFELVLIIHKIFVISNIMLPIFMIGFVLFIVVGCFVKHPLINMIHASSRDIGLAIMFFSILLSLMLQYWLHSGFMFLLAGISLFLAYRVEKRSVYLLAFPWLIPLSIGFAFMAFGEDLSSRFYYYEIHFGFAMNAVLGSVSLFLLSYLLKMRKMASFTRNAYFIGQGFYTLAILGAIFLPVNDVWMRPFILVVGVGIYLSLYFFTKYKWVPFIIACLSLIAYFSILFSLHLKGFDNSLFIWTRLGIGGMLLLAISYLLRKKDVQLAKGFAWIGHVYFPIALFTTLIIYWENSIWTFILAMAAYWLSFRVSTQEWKMKVFLYCALGSLFIVFSTGIEHLGGGKYTEYAYLLTSIAVIIYWAATNKLNKQRLMYFFIPFSLIGIFRFIVSYPFDMLSFITMLLYAIGLMIFLHIIKKDIFVLLPLFQILIGTVWFLFVGGLDISAKYILAGLFGVALMVSGQLLYQKIFIKEDKHIKFDSYSIFAFPFFCMMYVLQTAELWTQVVPGLLLSILFFLQRDRVGIRFSWLPFILAGIQLLQPYYAVINKLHIPRLIEVEMNVLPFIALIIFIRLSLKDKFRKFTSSLQWGILVIASLVLIVDAHASSTIFDAIILGTLALISLLAGMFLRVKSYFFVGSGVLLLNVLLQTRPFWGHLPWWAYLLFAGSILIAVASYNEWHKQKVAKGEKPLLSNWKNKFMKRMKDWK